MKLQQKVFRNFPIEYFQLNEKDFKNFIITKDILKSDKYSYLSDVLEDSLNLEEKNTVAINTPVGNGKSYAIIKTIKKYYELDEDYIIFIASPFVSLVEQYYKDIQSIGEIPKSDIYNYNNIGRNDISYLDKRIQVVTANLLLGNAGEDAYKNSEAKRVYLNEFKAYCEKFSKKVIFIYDEIHDTTHNFKEELIFNLWKWKNVIHKNFIISATFNEASKIVIEYLAELTDKKIQIIESERKQNQRNISDLVLHYSSSYQFSTETREIKSTILDIIRRGKKIDILCYSKTLAEAIIEDRILGEKLKDKFGEINNCTSENINNERPGKEPPLNRFDNNKCNIGTNFKSGVSIEKENHAFVIIMPPRGSKGTFKNHYGIFSNGITSIIQALARKRISGEIHIILPRPDEFNYDSLNHFQEPFRKVFEYYYDSIKHYENLENHKKVSYISLNHQLEVLQEFYDEEKKNVQEGIDLSLAQERESSLLRLEYPPFKNWILNKGENYLAESCKFLGGDLSSYITYCAITNQFVNCRLRKINSKVVLFFNEGSVQKQLIKYFNEFFGKYYLDSLIIHCNFSLIYQMFRNRLFREFILKYRKRDKNEYENIHPFNNPSFERQLIRFIAIQYYGKSYTATGGYKSRKIDIEFSREDYLLNGTSYAVDINVDNTPFDENTKERILAFQNLNYFRDKLNQNIQNYNRGAQNYQYLPVKPFDDFITTEEDKERFNQLTTYFIQKDIFVSNGVFEFIRNFNKYSNEQKINSFYTIMVDTFFVIQEMKHFPKLKINGKTAQVKPIIIPKGKLTLCINLVEPPMDITPQEYIDTAIEMLGLKDEEEYNKYQEELNEKFDSMF